MARITPTLLSLALAAGALAPTASAGDWGLSFGRRTRLGDVTLQLGSHGAGIQVRSDRHGHGRRRGRGHEVVRYETLPGHYETVQDKIWVPGYRQEVWVPAQYEVTCDLYGVERRRLVTPGHYDLIEHPGHYEYRSRRVWVPTRTIRDRGIHRHH